MAQLPKPPARDAKRFAPIFVLATARSYSSVITTMIGQHPDLAGFPELKLFCCETMGELEDSLPRYWLERGVTHRSPGLVRAVAEFEFGGQTLESLVPGPRLAAGPAGLAGGATFSMSCWNA